MAQQHLNDRMIKALAPPAGGHRITYDDIVAGFGIRITKADARAFVLRYRRKADGVERTLTIGSYPAWTTTAAREEAKKLKREVDGGGDPLGEQQDVRAAPTVDDLADRFEREVMPTRNRPSTVKNYRNQIRSVVRPRLGRLKVEAVKFADIDGLHRELSETPYHANRVLSLLSKMFAMAIRWQMRDDNPCRGVERYGEDKRERYLAPDEIVRLSAALDVHPERQTADIVRLLLLTGARLGEVLQARWADLDLEAGRWTKPSAHTKQKKTHVLPLSDAAAQLLKRVRADVPEEAEWVFPAAGGHRRAIKAAWASICKAAGIENARVHDLRHTHASILINQNYSLPIVGRLLGHTVPSTTMRYAHLADDPLRKAVEDAAAAITGKPSAEIVPMPVGTRSR
jgi:integrase